jgi:methylthioribose-1-phosphate isomerase
MKLQEKFTSLEFRNNALRLIDQRILPAEVAYVTCKDYREVEFAIRDMVVRGAPAIGAAAAYGLYLAALEFSGIESREEFMKRLSQASEFLDNARPTAVNLHWALQRMHKEAEKMQKASISELIEHLMHTADEIKREDIQTNKAMSRYGNSVIPNRAAILTHCNTGALATAGWGTALGVIKEAFSSGKDIFVYADETRPRLQGARLTAWELMQAGIPSKLIADSAAATLIRDGKIDCVVLGGDRVAANGDLCNKIGTFMLSVICKMYGVPFYSVVPLSTVDFETPTGADIPIEQRDSTEITRIQGIQVAPDGMDVYNPAFDITPYQNITGIITEVGIIRPPFAQQIEEIRRAYVPKQ